MNSYVQRDKVHALILDGNMGFLLQSQLGRPNANHIPLMFARCKYISKFKMHILETKSSIWINPKFQMSTPYNLHADFKFNNTELSCSSLGFNDVLL